MCHQTSCVHSPAEEASVGEESLMIYCKPVELYNILHRRSLKNPSFLQRCLGYRRQAMDRKRLQMKFSISDPMTEGAPALNLSSFYLLVTKPESDTEHLGEQDAVNYFLSRAHKFTVNEERDEANASLVLPDINVLSRSFSAGKLAILLMSCEGNSGFCLMGKIEMESVCLSLKRCVSLMMGHRTEMQLNVNLHTCTLKPCDLKEGMKLSFNFPENSKMEHIEAMVGVSEVGSDKRSARESNYRNISALQYTNIIRLREGSVIFNYRDLNNMLRKTEGRCSVSIGIFNLCATITVSTFQSDYWVHCWDWFLHSAHLILDAMLVSWYGCSLVSECNLQDKVELDYLSNVK